MAGGVALNELIGGTRVSRDIDLFHTEEAILYNHRTVINTVKGGIMKGGMVLVPGLLAMICGGCLTDVDANGSYLTAVIGDSNSAVDDLRTTWVQFIQDQHFMPQVHALLNGTETLENVLWGNSAHIGFSCVAYWNPTENAGLAWTNQAIAGHADGIVFAAGTNDLTAFLATPQDVVSCYNTVLATAQAAKVQMFIATTPPIYPPWSNAYGDADYFNPLIAELNALVRSTLNPKVIIDFDTGFYDPTLYLNGSGLHFNDAGEQLRAQRVARAILAAQR